MKKNNNNIYALIIAILIHLVIFLSIMIFTKIEPKESESEQIEQKIKLSLKDLPEPKQESAIANEIPEIKKAPPIPKGEQLEIQTPKIVPQKPTLQPSKVSEIVSEELEPLEEKPKKAFVNHTAKKVVELEKKTLTKEEFNLHSALSKADSSVNEIKTRSFSQRSESVQKLYGDTFGELSEGEQKYLLDNFEVMRRITQGVLSRYGPTRIPDSIRVNDINIIEFYLHPDGSISDMKMIQNSRLAILDATTKEVMELSYAKYPRPAQKTLIRYRVWYDLRGY